MDSQKNTDKKPITYIIGVHGIGEQRENESLLPIINGFARVRECQQSSEEEKEALKRHKKAQKIYRPLTQGMLSSQKASTPWVEFSGIPSKPDIVCPPKFIGRRVQNGECGENFRFIDMHWADVMQDHFGDYGQPVESWTASLIDRLKLRDLDTEHNWIPELIESIRKGILPVKNLFTLKQRLLTGTNNTLNDTIFNRFLGDAQLYGEYTVTRAEAVYRFHERLADVHTAHLEEMEKDPTVGNPRYVVIAHSLGSIMSFDALIYAHGKKTHNKHGLPVLDFSSFSIPGYQPHDQHENDKEIHLPRMDWVPFVDTFISLGSPIDKYLILWWMNYEHLIDRDWLETDSSNLENSPAQIFEKTKIQHYNYCDEQDPVGHELDTAYTAEVVSDIFEKKEDTVFMRYNTPGVAHVAYWEDLPLLRHIVHYAIDRKPESEPTAPSVANNDNDCKIDWFKQKAYAWTLMWSYFFIPSVGLALSLFFLALGYESSSDVEQILFYGISTSIFGFSLWGMSLMIKWRQLSQCARSSRENSYSKKNTQNRDRMRLIIRGIIFVTPLIWIITIALLTIIIGMPNKENTLQHLIYATSIGGLMISSLNLFWYIKSKLHLTGKTGLPNFLDKWITTLLGIAKKEDKKSNQYSLSYRNYILGDKTRTTATQKNA